MNYGLLLLTPIKLLHHPRLTSFSYGVQYFETRVDACGLCGENISTTEEYRLMGCDTVWLL
jgi:hypothetical protein